LAFIKYVPYEDGSDQLKKLYELYGGKSKTPSNIIRISGINPKVMKGHVDLYRSIVTMSSPLSRFRQEMIAVVVSGLNKCRY